MTTQRDPGLYTRRDLLFHSYLGLGGIALGDLLSRDVQATGVPLSDPLAPQPPHRFSKAKRCIFLFMEGGVSQMDTFEYVPALEKMHGKQMPTNSGTTGAVGHLGTGPNRVIASPYKFARYGGSGKWMSELFPHLATCVDELAWIHGIELGSSNHAPAVYHALTGNVVPGSPAVGSWVTYGLGTENRNLPGFVVVGRGAPAIGGAAQWGNGFLPAAHQGTLFRTGATPIVNLKPQPGQSLERQRTELDLLRWFNTRHANRRTATSELEGRIAAYETAFKMQTEAPELIDLVDESAATRKLYGIDEPKTDTFGRQCLLARRMVERGVRFVKLLHGRGKPWDQHGGIKGKLPQLCQEVDQPITGLLTDLKARGLLEETLVVWASEMGRTPWDSDLTQADAGRDHNNYSLVMWMAGGDVAGGASYGMMDEWSLRSLDQHVHIRDVHATLLHLLGLDQDRLEYLHGGRFEKLTDFGGRVIEEIIT
ncbi:MAG: DUF1501 domain-containing protein [Planctomycetota bacterium]|nr:DUF1501 domain-containing protein [Planctomycetota bacterium]